MTITYSVLAQTDGKNTAWRVIYSGPDKDYAEYLLEDMRSADVPARIDTYEFRPRKKGRT